MPDVPAPRLARALRSRSSSLVLDPPHGLRVQSYAPRRQKHGLMNADGWGVGFFDGDVAAALA